MAENPRLFDWQSLHDSIAPKELPMPDAAIQLAQKTERLKAEVKRLREALQSAYDSLIGLRACANVEVACTGSQAWKGVRDDLDAQCPALLAALTGGPHD